MSLKSIFKKSIASLMTIYMVFGNIAISGIGLRKVIAQESVAPAVIIESQVQKYIPYENEQSKGVVLQEKVSIAQDSTAETYKPVSKVELEIAVPSLNEILPTRVSIITVSTQATNGKEEGEISQNYNAETGLLTIFYENTENYNQYQENAKDEFEIIYIYPAEAKVSEELETTRTIKGKIEYYAENSIISSENTEEIKVVVKEKVGEITNYQIIKENEIYKGYMYANQNNKVNHETEYQTTGKVSILNSEIVDETEIKLEASKYIYTENEEEKELKTNTVIYKTSKVEENEFGKIYGENGYIDIYLGETKYATVNYVEEEENKKYATTYHIENAPENNEAGKIEYPEGTKEVTIKTSKPQTEGILKIENTKAIKAVENYGIKVEEIKGITENNKITSIKKYQAVEEIKDKNGQTVVDTEGNIQKETKEKIIKITEKENKGKIELKEPTAQMKLEMSNSNLSTLATNQTKITLTLNDTNSSCTLYEAGQIEIDLPENITSAKILSAQALYKNGLNITSATIKEGKIILTVEGKQTSYDTENLSGGVNIVIDLEINIADTVASHEETLEVIYGKAKTNIKVDIVSKEGVLVLNQIENYNSKEQTTTTIDNSVKTLNLDINVEARKLKQTINILNNYDEDVTSVEIIGRIGTESEKLMSNFNTIFAEAIKVTGADAKVYYSDNINANVTDESWSEKCTTNSRAYKIEIKGKTIKAKELLKLEYALTIPEKLTYNKKSYLETDIIYTYSNSIATQKSIFALATEEKDDSILGVDEEKETQLSVSLIDNLRLSTLITAGDKVINENEEVYEGQILRYTVTIENTGEESLKNLKIKSLIENAVYYEIRETGVIYTIDKNGNELIATEYAKAEATDTVRSTDIFSLRKNEKVTYEYQAVVSENVENVKSNIKILNASNNDELIIQKEIFNSVKQAKLNTELRYAYNEEREVYSNDQMNMILKINSHEEDLRNIKTEIYLPEELEIQRYEMYGINNEVTVELNDAGNVECTVKKMDKNSELKLILTCKTTSLPKELLSKDIKVSAKTQLGREEYYSNSLIKTIYQSEAGLTMEINKNFSDEDTFRENKELEYSINLKNNGALDLENLKVVLGLDKGLKVKELYINNKKQQDSNKQNIENYLRLESKEEVNLKYILSLDIKEADKEDKLDIIVDVNSGYSESLSAKNIVKISKTVEVEKPQVTPEKPVTPDNPPVEESKYSISGIAWMDTDKDGKRDNGESLFSGITVKLINKQNGEIIKDEQGNEVYAVTDENGAYIFTNLDKGTYLVVFEFDTDKYTVTTYQKLGIENSLNSDVTIGELKVGESSKLVGLTDYINVENSDITNIDVGLIENATFDLSLEKLIKSVTVITPQGTKITEYKNKDFAKTDLVAKYMNDTDVIITYKFVIKNEGDVIAYVDKLVDDLPSGLEFSSELNKDWYKGSDGNLYTTSLTGLAIQPGQTSETELILTKTMTEETTGTFTNNAELVQISNLEAIEEKEEAKSNNKASADLVISIKTGSAIMYVGITLGSIMIIAIGAYLIKKKVLSRGL